MAEYHGVHPAKVQPQGGGVIGKGTGCPGVQQQGVAGRLDIQAQAVFMGTARRTGGIFDQGDDTHGGSSRFSLKRCRRAASRARSMVCTSWGVQR